VDRLVADGERVGVLKVRLFRPFSVADFARALPPTVRSVAALDRTKEPGSVGEPLYVDVVAALQEAVDLGVAPFDAPPRVIGGRYGLSSKEFDPPMIKAVFDELRSASPKRHFTVGIVDDVTHASLAPDAEFSLEEEGRVRALFYGLGSDGTVSANKNSIKILGEDPAVWVQGYFVYDSKKSGSVTTSHLRFGPEPIRSSYLVGTADFVACHQFPFLFTFDVLGRAAPGATFLLNAPYPPGRVWDALPREVQEAAVGKRLRLFAIDAGRVARESGMGNRINTIMQTCFFALSNVLPRDEAIARIKKAVEKSYGARGPEVVRKNFAAIDAALANLHEVDVPVRASSERRMRPPVTADAPGFVQRVTAAMLANRGDLLPVSAFPPDGTWPSATSRYEKRNIAHTIPVWDPDLCIQCNKCTLLCPHATIRAKVYPSAAGAPAPEGFLSATFRSREHEGWDYTIQVAPEDCTGCGLCVEVCPAKDKSNPRRKALQMEPQEPRVAAGRESWEFFLELPETDRAGLRLDVKGSQFLAPLFEFSGACAGCGETPYVKLLTQLFGDRLLIANATGCSSIYGGNLPTTPYTTNRDGRGPAWSNSLFEDNAEFGLGMRLALDSHTRQARALVEALAEDIGPELARAILDADQGDEAGIAAQRERVLRLLDGLGRIRRPETARLAELADYLVEKSVWIVGGDGWAYDIGFGGLDHVLHSGRKVNVLVLDTEVYSNTGGQQSKATPTGAVAKFAASGKALPKKDLARIAMGMGHVYVAQVAIGARDAQTVRAFLEAEAYPGPSLILAYSPCIAHGYDLAHGADQQRLAVEAGLWPLLRFDPRRDALGQPPLQLDMAAPKGSPATFMANEARFRILEKADPDRWVALLELAKRQAVERWAVLQQLARVSVPRADEPDAPAPEPAAVG
jgi:pyruvate-ferredoxin/flavodoxin oxidoreductase